jgi:hypothetical protein
MVPAEWTDLVATGTGFEVSVVNVEFFYAERTCVIYVVTVENSV